LRCRLIVLLFPKPPKKLVCSRLAIGLDEAREVDFCAFKPDMEFDFPLPDHCYAAAVLLWYVAQSFTGCHFLELSWYEASPHVMLSGRDVGRNQNGIRSVPYNWLWNLLCVGLDFR
jgi:hypothetical protein